MNKLTHDKRVQILNLLVEGNSMRATARIADVAFNTVAKLFIETAKVCLDYQDKAFVNLTCKRLQLDEIWSFVYAKEKIALGSTRLRAQVMRGGGRQFAPTAN